MTGSSWHTAEGVLSIEVDVIDAATFGGPYLDRDWQGFCSNGHAVSYGTMVTRHSDPYWCDSCRDEHDDVLGYNCPDCAAEVKPGVVYSDTVRRVMPTSRSLYLDGESITKEAFNAIINRELGRQSEAKNQAAIARGRAALGMT